jgi:hypothetical protein
MFALAKTGLFSSPSYAPGTGIIILTGERGGPDLEKVNSQTFSRVVQARSR